MFIMKEEIFFLLYFPMEICFFGKYYFPLSYISNGKYSSDN